VNQNQARGIIERIDLTQKVKRLKEELDGDPATGAPGLRGAYFNTYRDIHAQERLITARSKMQVPPTQQAMADADMERSLYQLASLKAGLEYIGESIIIVEDELDAASKIGLGNAELETPESPAKPEDLTA
jgi:hypothetical protein